jgi:hypothetical protein
VTKFFVPWLGVALTARGFFCWLFITSRCGPRRV